MAVTIAVQEGYASIQAKRTGFLAHSVNAMTHRPLGGKDSWCITCSTRAVTLAALCTPIVWVLCIGTMQSADNVS